MDFLSLLLDPRRYLGEQRELARQAKARELALSLAELRELAGAEPRAPAADSSGFIPDLAFGAGAPRYGAREALEEQYATADAGYNPKVLAEAASESARTSSFLNAARGLAHSPSALGNLANKLDVSPYREGGGVIYDRFGGGYEATPAHQALAAERYAGAGASSALAGLRGAQTDEARLRTEALRPALTDTSPYVRADAANRRALTQTERVAVQTPEGGRKYVDATWTPSGWRYTSALDETGAPLVPPPEASRDSRTAWQKNAQYLAEVYGMSEADALSIITHARTQAPADAWNTIVRDVVRANPGIEARPESLRTRAAELWRVVRGEEPIPTDASSAPAAPPMAPRVGTPPAPPAPAPSQAMPGSAPSPSEPDAPPVPGARKSPKDGRWYVQRDGRWYLVEP